MIDPELLTIDPIEDITVSFNETSSIEVFTNYDLSEIKEIIWRNTSGEIVGNGPVYFFDNLVSQSYEVEVININGCFVKTRVNVIVDNEVKFIISNVIKIGTGQESKIVIRKNNIPANLKNVSVYDRWGSKVFTTPQAIYMAGPEVLELDWNGNFNGSELQQGVYILMMEFQDFFGNQKRLRLISL
ncbi:MAG: gliding motility-associated C-terminal domain-containing protein [Saprospiraceae bacterium]|nr:gliding motility-associated C-terminal domain-containing protein [Saprospiraceae bacterium]